MLRRVFRAAIFTALGRAWTQKSKAWLAIALGLILFRFVDRRAATSARKARERA